MHASRTSAALLVPVFAFVATVPAATAAASFQEPKIAAVHSKVFSAIDKKVATLPPVTNENRLKIASARAALERAFVGLDATFRTSSPERTAAAKRLVRAYSALNSLLKSLRNPSVSPSVAAPAKAPSAAVPPPSEPVAKSPSVSDDPVLVSLGEDADVLFYSDDFENGGTSQGDRFNQSAYSAARCDVELGRLLQVAYGKRSVVVKANDRPNCRLHPEIVDLTTTAFQALAPLSKGRLNGSVEVLGASPQGYRKEPLPANAFESLGIALDAGIPNTYLPGETLRVSGKVTDGKEDSLIFLKGPDGVKYSRSVPVENGAFSYEIPMLQPGKYDLVVASGMGFSTSRTQSVFVLSESAVTGRKILSSAPADLRIPTLRFSRKESSDLTPLNVLSLPKSDRPYLRTVTLSQPGKADLVRRSMGDVAFFPADATRFDHEKPVRVRIVAQESSTPFSLDVFGIPTTVFDEELPLVSSYAPENKERVSVAVAGNSLKVVTDLPANAPPLRNELYLITPSGGVVTKQFPVASLGDDGYVVRGKRSEFLVPLGEPGQYLAEIMYATGFPAYNAPFAYATPVAALLPNEFDSVSKDVDASSDDVVPNALRFINVLRKKVGLGPLQSDPVLESLALYKANDMADNAYVGHDDSRGQKIPGTAKRAGIPIVGSVGENVAGGSVGSDFLLAGLSLSGGHRSNMLGEWTKIGVASVVRGGMTYYVQVFGE